MWLYCLELYLCLVLVYAGYPSSRTVFYLHTDPATWVSARDTCARYEGRLVNIKEVDDVKADIEALDLFLGWDRAFSGLITSVWTGLYKHDDGSPGSTPTSMWHVCEPFATASSPNQNIDQDLMTSTHYCASMDTNYVMSPTPCDTKLPYICQLEEGQCWFLPIEDKTFVSTNKVSVSNLDLNDCAQKCRNYITGAEKECWGFISQGSDCELYEDSARHAFILDVSSKLDNAPGMTSYLKICTGGEPTSMEPIVRDSSVVPIPDNCTAGNGLTDGWDDGVCYCDCDEPPVIQEPEYLVLTTDEKVEKIVNELTINPSNTSSAFRKLNSAEDNRPSAQSLGALGIAIMVTVFGGLILLDLNVLISGISRFFGNAEEKTENDKM